MTTRQNPMAGRYFNDPSFAAAVSNLASAFAPPSPEEYLTAEKVKGLRTSNAALSDLYDLAGGDFDKLGVVADLYDPTQSYYAVDTDAATARRGQDVTAATTLDKARIDGAFGLAGTKLGYDEAMPGLPPDMAAALGLPAFAPQSGAALGAPAPALNESEMIARIMQDEMTPDERRAVAGASIDPVQIVGEDGKSTYADPLSALGQEAFVNPGSQAGAELYNYRTPDGREGTALFDPNTKSLVDAATKQPLPAGASTYKLQGGDKAAMTGATTSNITEGNRIVAEATYGLDRLGQFRQMLQDNPGVLGLPGTIRGFAQDLVAGAAEMGAAFGDKPGVIESVDEVRALAENVAGSGAYDPALASAYSYALEMAYLQAKMQDPGGEVNVKELATLLSTFDGGMAGNAKVIANLDVLEGQLNDRIKYGQNLRDGAQPGAAPAAPAASGATGSNVTSSGIQWSIEP
jgi:hypothetical protein